MDKSLTVSVSPHVKGKRNTKNIMLDVLIALLFPLLAGIYYYGIYALFIVAISVITCVLCEWLYCLITKKENAIFDLSCVVTGVILGLIMPPRVPFFIPIVAGVFAIVIVKMLFGGIGKNFFNPACTARVFVFLAYSSFMTSFISQGELGGVFTLSDGLTSATPLISGNYDKLDLFLGRHGGCIGETSVVAILLGFIYLVVRKVIDYKMTIITIVTAGAFDTLFGSRDFLESILTGGIMFAGVFMVTDYTTSPKNTNGRIIYALGIGFLTGFLRNFSPMPEGVSIAILFMNLIVPTLDKYVLPIPFGENKKDILGIVLKVILVLVLGLVVLSIWTK